MQNNQRFDNFFNTRQIFLQMKCPDCGQVHSSKYEISQQDIKSKFLSLNFPAITLFQLKMNEEIESLNQQKKRIQKAVQQGQLTQQQKQQLIAQSDALINSYKNDFKIFTQKLYNDFRTTIINQLQKLKIKDQQQHKLRIQTIKKQLTPIYQSQKFGSPLQQFLDAKSAAWMKKPLDMKTFTSFKKAHQSLDISIHQNSKITVNKIVDTNGKQFQGQIVLKSHFCDSIKQPEKLKSLPPRFMFDKKNLGSVPTGKLVSLSMQVNQFEDQNGKLLFPKEPIKVVQKVSSEMSPETLKQFKVWKWDDLDERWIQTGQLQVSQDGKEIKYQIQPKTKFQMIKIFQMIGETKNSFKKQLIFNTSKIKDISFILKQVSNAYSIQEENQKIKHQIRVSEFKELIDSIVGRQKKQKLRQYSNILNKITQEIKNSKISLFYDKLCNYFINKQNTIEQKIIEDNQELIFIPKQLRNLSTEYIYQSLVKFNTKSFQYNQEKIFIRSQQYKSYLEQKKFEQFETFMLEQKKILSIKSIYLQSPNKKYLQKYILINPYNTKFFVQDNMLQQINKQVNVTDIIKRINQDTMVNLRKQLLKWLLKYQKYQKESHSQIKQQKQLISQQIEQLPFDKIQTDHKSQPEHYPLHKIYEQDSLTIAQLFIQSKLQKIKLLTTNNYLLKLQLVILFSLSKDKLIEYEKKLRFKQTNIQKLKNQYQLINKRIGYSPFYQPPQQRFLSQYVQYFRLLAQQNDQTINYIIQTEIKNNLELSQHFMMKQVSNQYVKQFLTQIDNVFNKGVKRGLLDMKTSDTMKQEKINKIKKQYRLNQQWNSNQHIIQRFIKEFFPDYSFISSNYYQLINNIQKYHQTRSILSFKQDIEKFKTHFGLKFIDYLSKQTKNLPGGNQGTRADDFQQQLIKTYGPQAAQQAMKQITNIDYLTRLSTQQMNQFRQKAVQYTIQSKQRLPQNLDKSKKQVQNYIKQVNEINKNQLLTKSRLSTNSVSTQKSQSQKIMDNVKIDQINNKKVVEQILGQSNSNKSHLRGNNNLNQQLKDNLSKSKSKSQQDKQKHNKQQKNLQQINNDPNKQNKYPQNITRTIDDAIKASTILNLNLDLINQQVNDLKKTQQNSTNYSTKYQKITQKLTTPINLVKEQINNALQQIQKQKQTNQKSKSLFFKNLIKDKQENKKTFLAQFQQKQDIIQQAIKQIQQNSCNSLKKNLNQNITLD